MEVFEYVDQRWRIVTGGISLRIVYSASRWRAGQRGGRTTMQYCKTIFCEQVDSNMQQL
jgi:hypothetical protein